VKVARREKNVCHHAAMQVLFFQVCVFKIKELTYDMNMTIDHTLGSHVGFINITDLYILCTLLLFIDRVEMPITTKL